MIVPREIWTIGHSTRSWEDFLALLQSQRIERIVGVRHFPGSRKYPQFGQDELQQHLGREGISYLWIAELGGRRRPQVDSSNTVWRNPAFRAYADYMQSTQYRHGRELLLRAARERRSAMLCAEAVWWRCHRALIADDLKAAGAVVWHIMGPGKVVEHPFTSAARVVEGHLVYGPARGREE